MIRLAIANAGHADEIGIELGAPFAATGIDDLVPADDELMGAARRGFRRLSKAVITTRWAELLPSAMQRDEILSQLDGSEVRRSVADLRGRSIARVDVAPTTL